jgi:hypothetical protein
LPIETFHAKLIIADDTLAYVGSANLLNSSEGQFLFEVARSERHGDGQLNGNRIQSHAAEMVSTI